VFKIFCCFNVFFISANCGASGLLSLDPTNPGISSPMNIIKNVPTILLKNYHLNAIFFDGINNTAVVNDAMVSVGDQLSEDTKVVLIGQDFVQLQTPQGPKTVYLEEASIIGEMHD